MNNFKELDAYFQLPKKNIGSGLVAKSCPTLVTTWTIARHASLSMWFPKQEYWSGLPFPSPGDLPDPGIKPVSSVLQSDFLLLSYQGILQMA